ncbi:MAG: hypothetical protein ACJ8OJ_18595 [Povalibacter sp.]
MIKVVASALIAGLMLSGCGGGGGGGSGGNGGSGGGGGGGTKGTFTISPATMVFEASSAGGSTIASQLITGTVSGVSPQTLYLNIRVTGNAVAGVSDIAVTSPTTGTARVNPITQQLLGPGTFTSTIVITACTSSVDCTSGVIGSPQTVNVTYTVNGVRSSVDQLSFPSFGDQPLAGDLQRTFSVTGYPAQNWTAASSVPWLSVTPLSGNAGTATTVTASLDRTQLEALANGTYTGTITLTPTVGEVVSIPVSVNVSRVRVNYVAPYVAKAGVSDSVIIRGEQFLRYPVTSVRFGSVAAQSFTVISDTEVRAVHPSLTSGRFDVHLINAQGIDNTRATLVAVEPPAYASAALSFPLGGNRFPRCLMYDAERRALIMGVQFNDETMNVIQLLRYTFDSGWTAPTTTTLPSPSSCALSADGKQIITGFRTTEQGPFTVAELDPETLQQIRTTLDPRALSLDALGIAVSNDGRAIFATEYFREGDVKSYWPLRPDISDFRADDGIHSISTFDGVIGGSGDGSLVLLGSWNGAGTRPLYRYDSDSHQLAITALSAKSVVAVTANRTGSRVILNNLEVYDRDLGFIGTLPETTRVAALAHGSSRAYTYDEDGTIHTLDVSAAVDGSFLEIGAPRALTNQPGTGMMYRMLITPDDQALFLTGNQQIVLLPL